MAFWILGMFATGEDGNDNGWIWLVMGAMGLGAVITGMMARRGGRLGRRGLIGMVLGGLIVLLFLVFALGIVE